MSSDLPETHRSSYAMARCLTSYMDCPYAVQRRIREDFTTYPAIEVIRGLRQRHLEGPARRRKVEASKPHDGYYSTEASDKVALANTVFLRRLRDAYPERFAA